MTLAENLDEGLERAGVSADEAARLLALLAGSRGLRISIRDHTSRVVWVNRAVKEDTRQLTWDDGRLGTDQARYYDFDGRPIRGLDHPAQRAHVTGSVVEGEGLVIKRADGSRRWFLMSCYPLSLGGSGWSVLVVGTDVTAVWQRAAAEQAA